MNKKNKLKFTNKITIEIPIWLIIVYIFYAIPSVYTGIRFLIKDIQWLLN